MNERAGEESYELGTQEAPAAPAPLRAVPREGECFIGVSAYVAQLKEFIGAQAMQRHPVLLIADPGLRPEQVARALHEAGPQRVLPFYSVNARSLSGEALHRLLFGPHGVIETCQRGTVYLNDLASLPVMVQQRFAACIEEHRWRHSSGNPLQQRLVFATEWNPGVETKISAENRLTYGLVEVLRPSSFRLKPLRERSEDIPHLAAHLAERLAQKLRRGAVELTPGALKALTGYEWEVNIDELEAVLESAIGQTPPHGIGESLLPPRIRYAHLRVIPQDGIDLPRVVDDYERTIIATALEQAGGCQTRAARLLGLRVQTLNMKLKRFLSQERRP
jgi:two-component system, NtrC family, response regulator PilR